MYEGIIVASGSSRKEASYRARDILSDYKLSVKRDGKWVVVDAQNTNYEMKYINNFRGSGQQPNVKYKQDGMIIAIRDIGAGVELLVDYGEDFWANKKYKLQK